MKQKENLNDSLTAENSKNLNKPELTQIIDQLIKTKDGLSSSALNEKNLYLLSQLRKWK